MSKPSTDMRWPRYAAPSRFYALAGACLPWLWLATIACAVAGLYIGLAVAPTEARQGDVYRIVFVHVPAAWMSMLVYLAMAFWAALGWMLGARMASMLARALAPTGAMFTLLALVTGALWGRPTWGTWWVWDARLTSELILLLLYFGFMALLAASDDVRRGDAAAAVLAIVGTVNVPVIYFSVRWWNTLHQGASVSLDAAPRMAPSMLAALLLMTAAFWAYALAMALARARCEILEREAGSEWLDALLAASPAAASRSSESTAPNDAPPTTQPHARLHRPGRRAAPAAFRPSMQGHP